MESKSLSLYIVPSPLSEVPGEFMFYMNIVDYERRKPTNSRTVLQRNVNWQGAGDTDEIEWAISVCDEMYGLLSQELAARRRLRDQEINARPGDTTVPSVLP